MDPINYNVNIPNPVEAFQGGMMNQLQINAAKTAMANQAEDRQKAQLQAVWAAKSAEEQSQDLRMSGQMLSALNAKDSGAALSIIDARLQALKNSGNEKHAADLQRLRDIIEKHPESATQSLQTMLATVPGGDKIIESLGKIGEASQKAALAPGELEKQISDKERSAADTARIKAETNRINAEITRGRPANETANKKDWDEYQRLLKLDPEQAAAFGRAAGFVSQEGMKLSDFNSKEISESSKLSTAYSADAGKYSTAAEQIRKARLSGGLLSSWGEKYKEITGEQDGVTALRRQAMEIVNSEAIKALPPGPATDRDITLAREPFPTEKANGEYVANWLDAVSRLSAKKAEYEAHKAEFIAKNGGQRDASGGTTLSTWKAKQEEQAKADKANQPAPPTAGSSRFKIEVVK
jgi:hypothetical protein